MGAPTNNRLPHSSSLEPSMVGCLTPDQAFAFVAQASGALPDPDVQAHLDKCERCRIFVGEAARSLTASSAVRDSRPKPQPLTLRVGEVVAGRYEILRYVASGGMGEVYEARDDTLDEVVALKTLQLTDIDDSNAVARLRREVRLARKVTHPNVCRILEFGQHHPSGRPNEAIPFLTMELLAGDTLAAKIAREGRLSGGAAARLLEPVLAGLGAVHAAGIVHRDVKPQNIFIVPGPPERVLVMDFGLARRLSPTQSAITGGSIVGTADYMAPEQIQGLSPHRTFDVYAIGVVTFEMLTGKKPFAAQSLAELASDRARRTPPRPSSLVPALDPRWDDIVLRCLAFEPRARFGSVDELADRIRTDILHLPSAPKRRPYVRSSAVALVGLALLASSAVVVERLRSETEHARVARASHLTLVAPAASASSPVPAAPSAQVANPPPSEPATSVSARPPAAKRPAKPRPASSSDIVAPRPNEDAPELFEDMK